MLSFDMAFTVALLEPHGDHDNRLRHVFEALATSTNQALRLPALFDWYPYDGTALAMIIYEIYVIIGQLFLLNLLIGVVAAANMRVRLQAALVAQYERARFSQDKEALLFLKTHSTVSTRNPRLASCFDTLVGMGAPDMDTLCPRWIHVLEPPALESEEPSTYAKSSRALAYHEESGETMMMMSGGTV